MRLLAFVIPFLFFLNLASAEVVPCGEHPKEPKDLDWQQLASLKVSAIVMKVRGVLCIGSKDARPLSVVYRDDSGSFRHFSFSDLIRQRQILVTHEDLDIGIIKEGPIMGLKLVPAIQTDLLATYKAQFRFLRNLSRLDRDPRDERMLEFVIHHDRQKEILTAFEDDQLKDSFDAVEININLGLKLTSIGLAENGRTRSKIKTETLPRIDEIKHRMSLAAF